uniref:Uncharacterized protein n=1 Tax=Rhizophora mucronata TaxID=61149 RepID=A0A2P2QN45_RHIMU
MPLSLELFCMIFYFFLI